MKYALVTGSSGGIGFAIAKALIDKGYFVFLNGRRDYEPDFSKECCKYIKADTSTISGVETLVNEVLKTTDILDTLVLNAGSTCRKKMTDMSYDDWQKVMDTNVNMPFMIVKELSAHINDGGNILFIASAMGIHPHATSLPYGVSKAATISLAQNLVKELPKVRTNCVCPGFVDTDWQLEKPDWLREKISSKIALKRFAKPAEIADMCLSIIENTYMNGAVVTVDGGYDME